MADSGDNSPNKKEQSGKGSSAAKSPNKIETSNTEGQGSSRLVAAPSSPSLPQVSVTGAARADEEKPKNGRSGTKEEEGMKTPAKTPIKGDDQGSSCGRKDPSKPHVTGTRAARAGGESPKSGGSGTKEGGKGMKTPVEAPFKGGDQGSSGEKKRPRGRPRKDGSDPGSAGVEKPKPKRARVKFDTPAVPVPCGVCGKRFNNYKALFGHLRVHPGRDWKGAFPPPVSRPTAVEQTTRRDDMDMEVAVEISSTLLTIGRRIIGEFHGESSSSAAAAANPRRGLEVDLNMPEEIVHFPTPPESDESEDDAAPVLSGDEKK